MTLGQRILQIRTEHRLTQETFAEKLGTTRQTVSRWELDQTYPTLENIVRISRMFSVTTDSMLKDGISTFDSDTDRFVCGVYRNADSELVETEQFALLYYRSAERSVIGTVLYRGFDEQKTPVAVCEYSESEKRTSYTYLTEDGAVIANCEHLTSRLSESYDPLRKNHMRRTEAFFVDHSGKPLPSVKEAGIPTCLAQWKMSDRYFAGENEMQFLLSTGKTDYVFSIQPTDTNVYCGASYNIVFDLGLFGGRQFFRIRNYCDNTEPFCGFHADFSYTPPDIRIPTEQCVPGGCISTREGIMWCVKRYTDDEIVLQGCGDDEYSYRRCDRRTERFVTEALNRNTKEPK